MAVELRLRIGFVEAGGGPNCGIEASVDHGPFFRLHSGAGNLNELAALEGNAWAYGQWLGEWLFSDSGLRSALEFARAQSQGNVRVRLEVGEDCPELASLRWERAMFRRGEQIVALGADDEVFLSRTLPVPLRSMERGRGVFRLGLFIASPEGLPVEEGSGARAIPVQREIDSLLEAWRPLIRAGQLRVQVVARVGERKAGATVEELQKLASECDGLHIICHGGYAKAKDEASLLLESAEGGKALVSEGRILQALESDKLRLVFLQACESAQRGKDGDVWSGLGAKIAKRVAGVVAMQEQIRMDEARIFASRFYASLLASGEVDRAANAGRRAIRKPGGDSWAIPVLYLDPRVPIWEPDEFRGTIHALAREFEERREVQAPFPVEVVRAMDPEGMLLEEEIAGARIPVMEAIQGVLQGREKVGALLGQFGRAKSAQLYRAYVEIAARSAQEDPAGVGLPLFLRLRDFDGRERPARMAIAQAARQLFLDELHCEVACERIEEYLSEPVTILLDADDVVDGRVRQEAFGHLREVLELNAGTKLLVVSDQQSFLAAKRQEPVLFEGAAVFFVQLLSQSALFQFLHSEAVAEKGCPLYSKIESANLFDVASVPWLLSYLIDAPIFATSRSAALARISETRILANCGPAFHKQVREGLSKIAMAMQKDKTTQMSFAETQSILRAVGAARDIPPETLRREVLASQILVRTEDDSVRFAYPGFQSYWCARNLVENPESLGRRLGDITASLGRLNRAKFWEDTVVILAGILPEPGVLIGSILAGSSMAEGEQIHIACRAIHEARQAGRAVPDILLRQVSASLVRLTRPGPNTEYLRRVRAVRSLGLLRYPPSVPHLLRLASEKVRKNAAGVADYDLSGIRQEAIGALRAMQDETQAAVRKLSEDVKAKEHAEALLRLLQAWRDDNLGEMRRLGVEEDCVASVSFLLLGFRGGRENLEFLLERICARETTRDSQWAITDALLQFDPGEIARTAFPKMQAIPELQAHCIYLLGRLGSVKEGSAEQAFLERAIQQKDSRNRGMALRSMAQAGRDEYREVCHALMQGKFGERVEGLGEVDLERTARERLIRYALESLKLIGNAETLRLLGEQSWAEAQPAWSDSLVDLYLETSEEIYWKLTRGMEKDVLVEF